MAIGFEDLNGTVRVPDKGMTLATTPKVRLANFGDGYTQRISYGINSLAQQFSVSFNDRTKAEIDAIVSFLNEKEGVESFDFTFPFKGDGVSSNEDETELTIRVYCSTWQQSFSYDDFYSLSATFIRVYESNGQ